jgi:hypothetical protein
MATLNASSPTSSRARKSSRHATAGKQLSLRHSKRLVSRRKTNPTLSSSSARLSGEPRHWCHIGGASRTCPSLVLPSSMPFRERPPAGAPRPRALPRKRRVGPSRAARPCPARSRGPRAPGLRLSPRSRSITLDACSPRRTYLARIAVLLRGGNPRLRPRRSCRVRRNERCGRAYRSSWYAVTRRAIVWTLDRVDMM